MTRYACFLSCVVRGVWCVTCGVCGGWVVGRDVAVQVMDAGQFVMQSGQLSGVLSPCTLTYFVEYFTPFTGLLPLVRTGAACLA